MGRENGLSDLHTIPRAHWIVQSKEVMMTACSDPKCRSLQELGQKDLVTRLQGFSTRT